MAGRIRHEERQLPLRLPLRSTPEQDNRRPALSLESQEGTEIRVRRDEDSVLPLGKRENFQVFGRLQAIVAHMGGVVPALPQLLRDDRR